MLGSYETFILLGLFFGVAARSLVPFLRKVIKEGQEIKWDNKYLAILMVSAIVTLLTYPAYYEAIKPAELAPLLALAQAFVYGFAVDTGIIEGFEWLRTDKTLKLKKPAT